MPWHGHTPSDNDGHSAAIAWAWGEECKETHLQLGVVVARRREILAQAGDERAQVSELLRSRRLQRLVLTFVPGGLGLRQ